MKTIEGLTTERYTLACHNCQRTWKATYQVLSFHDDAGDHRLYYYTAPACRQWLRGRCGARTATGSGSRSCHTHRADFLEPRTGARKWKRSSSSCSG
jgi:hypothetical protein